MVMKTASSLHTLLFNFLQSKQPGFWWIVNIVVGLSIIKFSLLASNLNNFSFQAKGIPNQLFFREILWVILGFLLLIIFSNISYLSFEKINFIILLYTSIIFGLIYILIFSDNYVTRRFLYNYSIQVSEFATLALMICCAWWIKYISLKNKILNVLGYLFLIFIPALLIMLQPDISEAFEMIVIGLFALYISGIKQSKHTIYFLILIFIVVLAISFIAFPTAQTRINSFIMDTPSLYHIQQSVFSIYVGGLFGQGLGQNPVFIPLSYSDSSFSVLIQQLGSIWGMIILSCYLAILFIGLKYSNKCNDLFGKILSANIVFFISFQVLIHCSSLVNLIPFVGVPLPFISIGGSNFIVSMMGIGLLLNIINSQYDETK